METQSEKIRSLHQQLCDDKTEFRVHVQSLMKYEAFLEFLRRIISSKKLSLEMVVSGNLLSYIMQKYF